MTSLTSAPTLDVSRNVCLLLSACLVGCLSVLGSTQAKVADFGISRLMPSSETIKTTAVVGSPGYVDPEHIHTLVISPSVDVFR